MSRTKILIVGDSPILPTGMAEVIRLIFSALLDKYPDQYELHQLGLWHSYAVATPKWPVYPTKGGRDKERNFFFLAEDMFGQTTFREILPKLRPDIVFAFNDSQRLLHLCCDRRERTHRLVLYVCFDGFPYTPNQGATLSRADLVVTMSEFSKRVVLSCLPAINADKVDYMYSPADISRFRPVSENEKMELRSRCLPEWIPRGAFVLGWIGRNQWRKQIWTLYSVAHHLRSGGYLVCHACGHVSLRTQRPLSWSPPKELDRNGSEGNLQSEPCRHCRSSHTELAHALSDVFLWLHMPEEPGQQEWDRSYLESEFEVKPGKDIHYSEGHTVGNFKSPVDMAGLYQVWDALLYLSGGEGFGMPAWEAMCAGLPVVYTNYSSHAEFLTRANAGIPVGGVLQPEKGTCIWRMIADVEQAVEAIRKIYFRRALGTTLGGNGRSFVLKFAPEIQAERWHFMLQKLMSLG